MRQLAAGLIVCVLAVAAWGAETAEVLNEAQQLYENERYAPAAEMLEALLDEQPDAAEAHRLLGHVRLAMNQPAQARAAFVRAIEHGRVTVAMLSRLIRMDQQAGRLEAALTSLSWRALLAPEAPDWEKLRARLLMQSGRHAAAKRVARSLIERHPADTDALLLLGNAHLRTDSPDQALSALTTAYHLGAGDARLAATIAQLHQRLDRPDRAAAWYVRARELTGDQDQAARWTLRRAALRAAANEPQPGARLSALAEAGRGELSAEAAYWLGQFARQRGEAKQALQYWQRAVELGYAEPAVLARLGAHHFNAECYERAAALLQRRLEAGSENREMRRSLILSLLRLKRFEAARQQLIKYLAHHRLDEPARKMIAKLPASTAE